MSVFSVRPFVLLLALASAGCSLVPHGESAPLATAPPPPVFAPPLGSATVPTETAVVQSTGGVIELATGTRIAVPANAFVDTAGEPVTGPVDLRVREFLNPLDTWLGGVPMQAGDDAVLRSAGMMEIRGTATDGREVDLAAGKTLQIDWYSVDDGTDYVTWALDTATGVWTETGTENTVDIRDLEAELEKAESQLAPRVNPVPPGRHAFDIGDMTGKQPELERYRGVQFVPVDGKPCGHDATRIEVEPILDGSGGAFLVRFIVDTVVHMRFKASSYDTLTYLAPYPIDSVTECRCNVALPPGAGEKEAARIHRLLNGKTERQRARGREAAMALWGEYNAAVERQFLTDVMRPSTLPNRPDRPGRVFSRSMQTDRLGWINCDIVIPYPEGVDLMVDFIAPDGRVLDVQNLAVMEVDTRTLYPCPDGRIRLDPDQRNAVFGYADGQLVFLTRPQVAGLGRLESGATIAPMRADLTDLQNPASDIAQLILGG